jgi:transposase-like protein
MTIGKRTGKVVKRYSEAFKLQVVREFENGAFSSEAEARRKYGITGTWTVRNWLVRYGKGHLMKKVIRVETPGEKDRLKELEREVKRLKQALGDAHIDLILGEEYLKIACRRAGEPDVEAFKKKNVGLL